MIYMIHETTGYTPNRLTFGRDTRASLDVIVGIPPREQRSYDSLDQFIAERQAADDERGVLCCP